MERITKIYNDYGHLMERDTVGVQLGCYSVALIGFTIAVRRVRPFSKFKKPNDIPNHFIQEKKQLLGSVRRIDPNGAVLMIEHKPLISIPGMPKGELPVKILGVNVSGLGISWLQTVVVGSEVTFIPVKRDKNFVQCQVLLPQKILKASLTKKKKRLALLHRKENPFLNVGEALIRIGFGEVTKMERPLLDDTQNALYYKCLHSAELYALRKKLGLKYYIKPTVKILTAAMYKIQGYLLEGRKRIVALPKLVLS